MDTPELSDRQIAGWLGVSHPTVAAIRDELLESGQVGNLPTSTGADGKVRVELMLSGQLTESVSSTGADASLLRAILARCYCQSEGHTSKLNRASGSRGRNTP